MKKLAALVGVLAIVFVFPMVSHAAEIGSLTIEPSTVAVGDSMTISGSCGSGAANGTIPAVTLVYSTSKVNLTASSTTSMTTDSSGSFSIPVTIPSNVPDGSGTVTVTCPNGTDTVSGTLTVAPSGAVSAGAGGMSNWTIQLVAMLGLLGAGATGLVLAKRNAQTSDNE